MSEHTLIAAMLVFVGLLAAGGLGLVYRVYRTAERIEGITAATYLEARKILESRSC